MSDTPQDYENRESPRAKDTNVRDFPAERDIKRTVTTSQLILMALIGSMGIISYFGDRFVKQVDSANLKMTGGFESANKTLVSIREEITLIRTGSQLNTRDIGEIKVKFDGIKVDVDANTKGYVRLCTKLEDANKDWRCDRHGR